MLVAPDWGESKRSGVIHAHDFSAYDAECSEDVKIVWSVSRARPLLVLPLPGRVETETDAFLVGVAAHQSGLEELLPHLVRHDLADLQ